MSDSYKQVTPAAIFFHHWHKIGGSSASLSSLINLYCERNPDIQVFIYAPGAQICNYLKANTSSHSSRIEILNYRFNIAFDGTLLARNSSMAFYKIIYQLFFFLPVSAFVLLSFYRLSRSFKLCFVFYNESILSIISLFASAAFAVPSIIICRAVMSKFFWSRIAQRCALSIDHVYAIDKTVKNSLCPQLSSITQISCNNLQNLKPISSVELHHKLPVRFEVPIIGFLGSLIYNKGFDHLLAAAFALQKSHPHLHFKIGGPLKSLSSVQESLISNALGCDVHELISKLSNITLLDTISDLDAFYRDCSCVLFPSRYQALGRPAIEAASQGLPLLCRLADKDVSFFEKNITGYSYDSNSPSDLASIIAKLFSDFDEYKTLSVNSLRLFSKDYSSRLNCINQLSVYSL